MKGKAASNGMAYAIAYPIREPEIQIEQRKNECPQKELQRFQDAKAQCIRRLEELIAQTEKRNDREIGGILDFQLLMLEDTDYIGKIETLITDGGWNSEYAVNEASQSYQQYLCKLTDNPYLRERAGDVSDLNRHLLGCLAGVKDKLQEPDEPYIAVAVDLSPSQVMEMKGQKLQGIVLEQGAMTAHTVIIARSRGIPCLIGVEGALKQLVGYKPILLDTFSETVTGDPDEAALARYRHYRAQKVTEDAELKTYRSGKTQTLDGFQMKIYANITSAQETEVLLQQGGEGVGLFRTELLYMKESNAPPEEEVQLDVYRRTAEALRGRPLIIRTLDVGGDKKIPYLGIEQEENPFLGYRAIRYCLEHKELFRTQLRAILQASAYGTCQVMFPMIATLDELQSAKRILKETKEDLRARKILFDENIRVGMMVETPAAALEAARFAQYVDFFSIGTNDLTQYLFAADRTNDKVNQLNSYFQPTLLRCVNRIVRSAHAAGIEVDICGQAGEVLELVPLWTGMGVDALSVSIPMIAKVRRAVCQSNREECTKLLEDVLQMESEQDVRKRLISGSCKERR